MREVFAPDGLLRNSMVQTVLASAGFGAKRNNSMLRDERKDIIELDSDVQLVSSLSCKGKDISRGLFVLLHGWEGSMESSYVLRTGKFLYERGFSILRLNFRDHGDTHHLSPEPFNGSLMPEVYQAIRKLLLKNSYPKVYLGGFSLGGNFSLQIAAKHSHSKDSLPGLEHVFAISPAIRPKESTEYMDRHPILRRYFLKKWTESLLKKKKHFPELFPKREMLKAESVMDLTEKLIPNLTPFPDVDRYFASYTLHRNHLEGLRVKTTIVTSKDDPIIPFSAFQELMGLPNLEIIASEFGGHNGFILNLNWKSWYRDIILNRIQHSESFFDCEQITYNLKEAS